MNRPAGNASDPGRDPAHQDTALRDIAVHGAPPIRRGHPSGLYLLFTVEMWERFSFYGLKAFLVLYITGAVAAGGLGWSEKTGGLIMGTYGGLVYLTPILGGFLADRYLGTHRAMLIGGWIIALGHFTLAVETTPTLFLGLLFIIIGTGFFKSTVSAAVGQLYAPGDNRRDAAFTIFYMGINLGAFAAPLVCDFLRVQYGWRYGFAAAGVGMLLGQVIYVALRRPLLGDIGAPPAPRPRGGAAAAPRVPLTSLERRRIAAILIVTFMVIFFWTAFEQASTSLTFFAQQRTDLTPPAWLAWATPVAAEPAAAETDHAGAASPPAAAGPQAAVRQIPVGWFQSINPLLIILLAPLFASMWTRLAASGREPSVGVKMGVGMLLAAGGYVVMIFAAQASEGGGSGGIIRVSPWWLVATYFLTTCGELCLSPVGLSMISRYAPAAFVSQLMGVWFCAIFIANFAAGALGGMVNEIGKAGFVLSGQAGFFLLFVIGPGAAGLITLALSPAVRRLFGPTPQ